MRPFEPMTEDADEEPTADTGGWTPWWGDSCGEALARSGARCEGVPAAASRDARLESFSSTSRVGSFAMSLASRLDSLTGGAAGAPRGDSFSVGSVPARWDGIGSTAGTAAAAAAAVAAATPLGSGTAATAEERGTPPRGHSGGADQLPRYALVSGAPLPASPRYTWHTGDALAGAASAAGTTGSRGGSDKLPPALSAPVAAGLAHHGHAVPFMGGSLLAPTGGGAGAAGLMHSATPAGPPGGWGVRGFDLASPAAASHSARLAPLLLGAVPAGEPGGAAAAGGAGGPEWHEALDLAGVAAMRAAAAAAVADAESAHLAAALQVQRLHTLRAAHTAARKVQAAAQIAAAAAECEQREELWRCAGGGAAPPGPAAPVFQAPAGAPPLPPSASAAAAAAAFGDPWLPMESAALVPLQQERRSLWGAPAPQPRGPLATPDRWVHASAPVLLQIAYEPQAASVPAAPIPPPPHSGSPVAGSIVLAPRAPRPVFGGAGAAAGGAFGGAPVRAGAGLLGGFGGTTLAAAVAGAGDASTSASGWADRGDLRGACGGAPGAAPGTAGGGGGSGSGTGVFIPKVSAQRRSTRRGGSGNAKRAD